MNVRVSVRVGAIDMRLKGHALFVELSAGPRATSLKAALSVRMGMASVPSHAATEPRDALGTGAA